MAKRKNARESSGKSSKVTLATTKFTPQMAWESRRAKKGHGLVKMPEDIELIMA